MNNMKRMRGRNHRGGGGGGGGGGGPVRHNPGNIPMNRNHVFDSSGPDLRIRGTAQQLFEKYLQLGRDAASSGDRVMGESYFQHAEHYFRILGAMAQAQQNQGQANGGGTHNGNGRRHPGAETGNGEFLEEEDQPAGYGDQPGEHAGEHASEPSGGGAAAAHREEPQAPPVEPRQIPIAAAPPDA